MVLIRPVEPAKKIGSVELPDAFREDLKYLVNVGRVLRMGPLCYRDSNYRPNEPGYPCGKYLAPWCKTGDYVVYGKNVGLKMMMNGVPLVLLADDQIIATTEDPNSLNPFFNVMKGSAV